MRKLLTGIAAFFVCILPAWSQCTDSTTLENITDNVLRTSGNQVFSFSQSWVSGDYASVWSVYAAAQITKDGNPLHSGSDTQGEGATASVSWNDTLQTVGAGAFAEADQHRFTNGCGTNDYFTYTDRNLTVTAPTISLPGSPVWGAGHWAFWYLDGNPSIDNYATTAAFTGNPNLGTCSGCSPVYNWQIVDRPTAMSLSSTNTTTTTATSQQASGGNIYDVSLVFTVDGFSSDKVWINLNHPVGMDVGSTNQVSNPDGCSNPSVNGGYDNQFYYYIYDLWDDALSPITTNEQNNSFSDDTTITSGWHYASNWQTNSVWSPSGAGYPWANSFEFVDHIYASNCSSSWNPAPVAPAGLNSPVQHTPQAFHTASSTTGAGVPVGNFTQTWYTDHGTN